MVPWMLASGLLVSFTATAGTDATLRPAQLSERDVTVTGALVASTAWSPDVIDAGLVAPGASHESEPGEDGLPALADSDGATPPRPAPSPCPQSRPRPPTRPRSRSPRRTSPYPASRPVSIAAPPPSIRR
ncbi:exported protein of unknown function [Methylorubrum extorquens]|uniref:Uncharacterized protein n=1 Tax=Methylorubrum extorquens TaxID=408 RepID=A0A2N9AQR8_METEX|nr:exported protein of unknown function [Methylorubrum extorquens]